jgi:hypothetical protein
MDGTASYSKLSLPLLQLIASDSHIELGKLYQMLQNQEKLFSKIN